MVQQIQRPGVTVSREVRARATPAVTPALPACIVGACYQIVEPIGTDGSLNSAALVNTPAEVRSSTVLTAPLLLSGKALSLRGSDGQTQTVLFPTTVGGAGISTTLALASINKQLTNVRATIRDGYLYLQTVDRGASSALEILAVDLDGYSALGLTAGTRVTGTALYLNTSLEIPFSALPATKTSTANLAFDTADIDLYKYVNGSLTVLSAKRAIARHSYCTGVQGKVFGTTVSQAHTLQPITVPRTPLIGIKREGTRTDTFAHAGAEASVVIPLGHSAGAGLSKYPDVTGLNYLSVRNIGLGNAQVSADAPVGNYVGQTGNDITVKFRVDSSLDTGAASAAWVSGDKQLLIKLDSNTVTFAALATALEAITNLDPQRDLEVALAYPASEAATAVFGGFDLNALSTTGITFYLSGGQDPADMLTAPTGAQIRASITGSTKIASGVTPATLGIAGESLFIEMNGAPAVEVVLTSGTPVVDLINTALTAAFGAADSVYAQHITTLYAQDANSGRAAMALLQIAADPAPEHAWYKAYQDSTLRVWGSISAVTRMLFTGSQSKTSTISTPSRSNNGRTISIAQSVYNSLAQSDYEKALIPGNQVLTLNGVRMNGALVFEPDQDAVAAATDVSGVPIAIKIDAGTSTTVTVADWADYDEFVDNLKAAVAGSALGTTVSVSRVTINTHDTLILAGTSVTSIRVTTTSSDADLLAALVNGSTTTLIDEDATTGSAVVTMADTGTANALTVTSVSNNFTNAIFASTIAFDLAETSHLTDALFGADSGGDTAGDGVATIDYSSGLISLSTVGDAHSTAGSKLTAIGGFTGSTLTVAFKQVWPHAFGATLFDYSRVFHGASCPVATGDSLYSTAGRLGTLVATGSYSGYAGALLRLSETTGVAREYNEGWHVYAENLDVGSRTIAPEVAISALTESIVLKHALVRAATGIAFGGGRAPIYAGYKALRLDVSASAAQPAPLVFRDMTEVESAIGPVAPENPLAFGLACAFDELTTRQNVFAMGIDEVSSDAPDGTAEAFSRAYAVLETVNAFCIAPLTMSRGAHTALIAHVDRMNAPTVGRYRAGVFMNPVPTEKHPLSVITGLMTISDEVGVGTGKYELTLVDASQSFITALNGKATAAGTLLSVGVGTDLSATDGVWIDRPGDGRRYLVTKIVSDDVIQIETGGYPFDAGSGPATEGNNDDYFATTDASLASFEADGEACAVNIRSTALNMTSTTGRRTTAIAMADAATSLKGTVAPSFCALTCPSPVRPVNGVETVVAPYYVAAAWAGMTAAALPKQGFTNRPFRGFTRVSGTNDTFSDELMDLAAGGGVNWIIFENGSVFSRHQLTTDTTDLATREWSSWRQEAAVSRAIRATLQTVTGQTDAEDPRVLQTLQMTLMSLCANLSGSSAKLVTPGTLSQDLDKPDQLAVDVQLVRYNPLNRINVRIFS